MTNDRAVRQGRRIDSSGGAVIGRPADFVLCPMPVEGGGIVSLPEGRGGGRGRLALAYCSHS